MVIEPNEDQRANFELRGTAMSLEAEVERLRAENERLLSVIEKCGGYCWNATHEPELTAAVDKVIGKIMDGVGKKDSSESDVKD